MPEEPLYAPLTEEEKQQVVRRHKELVDRFNQSLPDDKKLTYDPDLEKKIEDPKFYVVGQQMKEKRNQ